MARYAKQSDEHRAEWARLVMAGVGHHEAAIRLGVPRGVVKRWSIEEGVRSWLIPNEKPRRKKPPTKFKILDKLLASPLGTYPDFLADYRAASL